MESLTESMVTPFLGSQPAVRVSSPTPPLKGQAALTSAVSPTPRPLLESAWLSCLWKEGAALDASRWRNQPWSLWPEESKVILGPVSCL